MCSPAYMDQHKLKKEHPDGSVGCRSFPFKALTVMSSIVVMYTSQSGDTQKAEILSSQASTFF